MPTLKLIRFNVSGFKAVDKNLFIDTSSKMTLLVGMNGSGKSSILQAIGFSRFFADGSPQVFFSERGWDRQDLRFRSNPRGRATVVNVGFLFESDWGLLRWDYTWGLNTGKTVRESIRRLNPDTRKIDTILSFNAKEGGYVDEFKLPAFAIAGSIMSLMPDLEDFGLSGQIASAVHTWGRGIRSLELLAPPHMRVSTRLSPNDMGIKGDRLAGFLASLSQDQKNRIVKRLSRVYPISQLSTVKKRAGWIDLRIAESYEALSDIAVAHMSDGFMRLLAICAIPELPEEVSVVLLDELEDGIEPHILARTIDIVRRESQLQIIATSHSPLLLNAIPVEDIRVVGRRKDGRSIVASASELKTFEEGSEYLGAGEQWVTVDLEDLNRELHKLADEKDKLSDVEFNEAESVEPEE